MKHVLGVLSMVAILLIAFWWLQGGGVIHKGELEDGTSIASTANTQTLPVDAVHDVMTQSVTYHADTVGYLAKPAAPGQYPGLLLIHEWWGLNDNIRQLAETFAAAGYVALAVDLYDGAVASTSEEASELAQAVRADVSGAFLNLTDAVTYLRAQSEVASDALASVGWCFGGGWAYEMAKNDLGIDASVMYYGRFSPADDLSMMRASILGHFGENDRSIAVDDVRQFEAKLKTLSGDHTVFVYPNAGHAFANEDNEEAYNEEAAAVAWQRTLEFLERELVSSSTELSE